MIDITEHIQVIHFQKNYTLNPEENYHQIIELFLQPGIHIIKTDKDLFNELQKIIRTISYSVSHLLSIGIITNDRDLQKEFSIDLLNIDQKTYDVIVIECMQEIFIKQLSLADMLKDLYAEDRISLIYCIAL